MRRLLIAAAIILAVLAGGSFAAWRWAVGQMQTQFAAWSTAQQAQGWTITHGEPRGGGWPLAAALIVPNLSLSGLGNAVPGGMAWTGETVTAQVSLLQPRLLTVRASGVQSLRFGGGPVLDYTAARFVLSAPLQANPSALALDAAGLHAANGGSVGLLQGQIERQPAPALALFRLTAEAISFPPPPAPQPPLGSHIASASLEAVFSGTLPDHPSSPADTAATWQESGGKLEVHRLAIGWGPLGVSGTAVAGLDPARQPSLSANLHLVGFNEALQALTAAHVISPNAGRATAAVLSLMAAEPQGGGTAAVEVPLTLKDRTLSMGRIPLAKLPELVWPTAPAPANVTP